MVMTEDEISYSEKFQEQNWISYSMVFRLTFRRLLRDMEEFISCGSIISTRCGIVSWTSPPIVYMEVHASHDTLVVYIPIRLISKSRCIMGVANRQGIDLIMNRLKNGEILSNEVMN